MFIPNDPMTAELQAIALKAFNDAEKGHKLAMGSRLALVYCLVQSAAHECHALVKNQKGETTFDHAFTIADFCDPEAVKAAVGDDSRAKGAMVAAVFTDLAGIAAPTLAQKQALSQAAPVAFGLVQQLGGDWTAAGEAVTRTPRGNVAVPGHVMLKEPKDDAPESELERYEKEKDAPFTIDGSKGRSFAELSRRVRPKGESREGNSGQGGDKARTMTRRDACALLLTGAKGGEDWVDYMAALSSTEIVAAIAAFAELKGDSDD